MRKAFKDVALITSVLIVLTSIGLVIRGNRYSAIGFFCFGECFCFIYYELAKHFPMAN